MKIPAAVRHVKKHAIQICEGSMTEIDKHHVLEEEVFTYRVSKGEKVFIFWCGKQVKILKGGEAQKFLGRMAQADELEGQLVMAKATGNFKRGNERGGK